MLRDALVAGINNYQYLPQLQAPAQDAEAIAQCLQSHGEFRVQRLPEVIQSGVPQVGKTSLGRLRDLEAALVRLFKPKGNNIPYTALFYFSGHGIQKEAGIQEGFLATSDSNPEAGFYGLSLFWLRRLLQESPVRQRIIILDCCHSGELINFLEADPGARTGTDRLFMAASREYEAAYESLNSPYSVFTQAVLEGLNPTRIDTGIVTNYALTNWVSTALKGELQQPLFECSGSEIVLTRSANPSPVSPATAVPLDQMICPYRGLEYFDETHAEYFFGREELTSSLANQLTTRSFLALTGASGSGKSSLLRAGLVARLQQGIDISESESWPVKRLTPTEHPIQSLASAFIDPHLSGLERAEQLQRVEQFLQDGGAGLARLVRASLPQDGQPPQRNDATQFSLSGNRPHPCLVLVIDQLEEVFTLCQGFHAEQERQQFFRCIHEALDLVGDVLKVVVAIRADFWIRFSLYDGLGQRIIQNRIEVTPLSYEQIKATIVRPAQKVGLTFAPNLIYTLLLDVIGSPGELPLLQYTLLKLWQKRQVDPETGTVRLTLETYTELGGIRGTLQEQATTVFNQLLPDEQEVAKRIFLALTQLGEGTEDTRRRVLKAELTSSAFSQTLLDRVLEKLIAAKLVIITNPTSGLFLSASDKITDALGSQGESGDRYPIDPPLTTLTPATNPGLEPPCPAPRLPRDVVDITHETLIRSWPLLQLWLQENREILRQQRRIERSAQEWDDAGQPNSMDYLLRGAYLPDAEEFLKTYPHELSALAHKYISISREESRRVRQESKILQIVLPSVLLATLSITFSQYRNALMVQTIQNHEVHLEIAQERAAIAQTVLQQPNSDPTTALLISRLAVEQGLPTQEAQTSLRQALQTLRLQIHLDGHQDAVRQITFSPNQSYMATASDDGTIRLWPYDSQQILTTAPEPFHVLTWKTPDMELGQSFAATMTFSPDGALVMASTTDSSSITGWHVDSGQPAFRLELPQPITHAVFSPDGRWIATASADRAISIWRAQTGQLYAQFTLAEPIQQLQFSADGTRLLTASHGKTAQIWQFIVLSNDPPQLKLLYSLPHPEQLTEAIFSPDGRSVLTVSGDRQVRLWNASTGKLHHTFSHSHRVLQAVFSPDQRWIASVDDQYQLKLWNTQSAQLLTTLSLDKPTSPTGMDSNALIAFSPDGELIATSNPQTPQASVQLWKISTGERVGELTEPQSAITALQFSPTGAYLATANATGEVQLWATDAGGELPTITQPDETIQWAAFVPSQPSASSTVEDTSKTTLNPLNAPTPPSESRPPLRFSLPFAAWRYTNTLSSKESELPHSHTPTPGASASPQASPVPSYPVHLLTATPQGQIRRWIIGPAPQGTPTSNSATPPNLQGEVNSPGGAINPMGELLPISIQRPTTSLSFSPDGQTVAIATSDGSIEIYPTLSYQTTQPLQRIQLPIETPPIRQIVFSPESDRLLTVSQHHGMELWDMDSGQLLQQFQLSPSPIQDAEFSPNGERIITAHQNGTARLWETASGTITQVFSTQGSVTSATFSPNGRRILVASGRTAKLFSGETGQLKIILSGHEGTVSDAVFSPDGTTVATVSDDGTTRLWDAETGEPQAILHPQGIHSRLAPLKRVLFSPDGNYLASFTDDGRIYLWLATWNGLLEMARDRSLRQLTAQECIQYLNLEPDICPTLDGAQSLSVN